MTSTQQHDQTMPTPFIDAPPAEIEVDRVVSAPAQRSRRWSQRGRRVAMRPRRVLVRVHRWLSFGLLAWLVVISITGAWLVVHDSVEGWLDSERYATTSGDVGPQSAVDAAVAATGVDGSEVGSITLPRNARGVYRVEVVVPDESGTPSAPDEEPATRSLEYFVDPGSGRINAVVDERQGTTWWLYRGHMYLWQDEGLFGVFDPADGWCSPDADGAEPGGLSGVVCDVIPDGGDMVAWFTLGWIVVLLTGFYLWYWPGVRRWSTALVVRRNRGSFALNMSIHKVVGLVVWVPLTAIAFTGAAFAFPNMRNWYQNVTPGDRGFALWEAPESAVSEPGDGRIRIDFDQVVAMVEERFPERAVDSIMPPADETGTYSAWVTRGFSPWTREDGGGNVYMVFDQYTGEPLYDGTPEEGNVFEQAWDDWSFPIHTGDLGGTTTRVMWVLFGLSPFALGITGVVMNRIRKRKRVRAQRAQAQNALA